jgi:hypothetical protein
MSDPNVPKILKQASSFGLNEAQVSKLQELFYMANTEQLESLMLYLEKYEDNSWQDGYDGAIFDMGLLQKQALDS